MVATPPSMDDLDDGGGGLLKDEYADIATDDAGSDASEGTGTNVLVLVVIAVAVVVYFVGEKLAKGVLERRWRRRRTWASGRQRPDVEVMTTPGSGETGEELHVGASGLRRRRGGAGDLRKEEEEARQQQQAEEEEVRRRAFVARQQELLDNAVRKKKEEQAALQREAAARKKEQEKLKQENARKQEEERLRRIAEAKEAARLREIATRKQREELAAKVESDAFMGRSAEIFYKLVGEISSDARTPLPNAKLSDTIASIKEKIADATDISVETQLLILNGKPLKSETSSLAEYIGDLPATTKSNEVCIIVLLRSSSKT